MASFEHDAMDVAAPTETEKKQKVGGSESDTKPLGRPPGRLNVPFSVAISAPGARGVEEAAEVAPEVRRARPGRGRQRAVCSKTDMAAQRTEEDACSRQAIGPYVHATGAARIQPK